MMPGSAPLIIDALQYADFLAPRNRYYMFNESWESGASDLGNTTEDLTAYNWHAWIQGNNIMLQREGQDAKIFLTDTNITEVDFTFDQNMHPCIAYVAGGIAKLYWYNTAISAFDTTVYSNIKNPRVSLDDKRRLSTSSSDIIFAYMLNNSLCYRLQRERFTIEHTLKTYTDTHNKLLWRIGMGVDHRFLYHVR